MRKGILVDHGAAQFSIDGTKGTGNTDFNPEASNLWVAIRNQQLLQDRAGRA